METIRATGGTITGQQGNIAERATAERLIDLAVATHGRLDILCNNAGVMDYMQGVGELDDEVWRRVLSINLDGPMFTSRRAVRQMRQQGSGSIVNIASISAKTADANFAAYSASKAGVLALTSSMAKELAPRGIRVNAVCPGLIRTNRVSDIWESGRAGAYVADNIPLGRAGRGDDVAGTVVFLCSDNAGWVTGQQWNVDGGQVTMR